MSSPLSPVLMPGSFEYKCGHTEAELASAGLSKWGLKEVSYFITGYPVGLGMTRKDVDGAVESCFADWQSKCGLSFRRAGGADSANIVMGVGRGQRAGFDGPQGILAYCYLPTGDNFQGQLEMLWDLDEAWTVDPSNLQGINFATVTKHELGHGIGLSHVSASQYPQQLMNPIYNPRISTPQSHDIADAQSRYGKPVVVVPPVQPPTPPTGGSGTISAKVQLQDGSIWGGRLTRLPSGLIAVEEGSLGLADFNF